MGIIARAAIKAAEEAAERSAANSAKGAARKAKAGAADAAHAADKVHPNGGQDKFLGTEIADGGRASVKAESKTVKAHSEQPDNNHHEQKGPMASSALGGGVFLIIAIALALVVAAFRKRKALSRQGLGSK